MSTGAENDSAFRYMEMAREQRESFLIFARVSAFFAPLQSDPRYATLLGELGLSDEALQKNQSVTCGVNC